MFNNKISDTREDERLEKLSDATKSDEKNPHQSVGSQTATMVVSVKDENGNAITTGTLTVLVSGSGLLGTGTGPASEFIPTGRAISITPSESVPGKYVFSIFCTRDSGV